MVNTIRVLFACIENSSRSQMAEAFARSQGAGCVEPYSVGSFPSGSVSLKAVQAMREVGHDISNQWSKSAAAIPDVKFDAVITMNGNGGWPLVRAGHRDAWDIADTKGMSLSQFRDVRDRIEMKVKMLLASLAC